MLNERGVREQLEEVRVALANIDNEREALQAIETSLLHWLDLHAVPNAQLPLSPPPATPAKGKRTEHRFAPLGTIKLPDAIIRALRNRPGIPMKSDEILETAKSMGVKTNAKDPIGVVEWNLYDIVKKNKAPIKKTAPHTYVYLASSGNGAHATASEKAQAAAA